MGEPILLTSAYTMVAVVEAVLAVYIFIADSKSRTSRAIVALIVLFGINNISVIGMLTTFTLGSAQFYHWMLIATTYAIGPAIFLVSLIVLRPKLGWNPWVYSILLSITALPFIISTIDGLGISSSLTGQSFFYTALDPSEFSGAFIESTELTFGSRRPRSTRLM